MTTSIDPPRELGWLDTTDDEDENRKQGRADLVEVVRTILGASERTTEAYLSVPPMLTAAALLQCLLYKDDASRVFGILSLWRDDKGALLFKGFTRHDAEHWVERFRKEYGERPYDNYGHAHAVMTWLVEKGQAQGWTSGELAGNVLERASRDDLAHQYEVTRARRDTPTASTKRGPASEGAKP